MAPCGRCEDFTYSASRPQRPIAVRQALNILLLSRHGRHGQTCWRPDPVAIGPFYQTMSEAVEDAAIDKPDGALMDIRLARGTSGIDASCEVYSSQGLRCIFLSANLDEVTPVHA